MNRLRRLWRTLRDPCPSTDNSSADRNGGGSVVELLLARLMLGAGVLFVFAILLPTLDPGMLAAGDDTIHSAYTLETARLWQTEGRLFDWTTIFGLGEPIYIFRPPGFYFAVLALRGLSFGALPIMVAHKLAYVLALALYPVALYYLLWKFRFPPLLRGLAALLAFGAISTFGHTLDAYYNLGLAKQAFAILLFPFALGKLHGIVAHRERLLPGALLFGLMFLSHPYMGWSFCLIAGAYVLTACLAQLEWRWWWRVARLTGTVIGAGLALVSFWLVPFYASEEIQLTSPYSSTRREGFAIVTDTAAGTLRHLVRGSLFDRSPSANPPDVFGGKSDWAWRPNPGHDRWPVLSWFSLAGAALLLARGRNRRDAFFVNAWVLSLMIFMGPDDMRWLLHVPAQNQFQYLHFIPFPELFTICLAAIGIHGVASAVWRCACEPLCRRHPRLRAPAYAGVVLACALPFAVNVMQERRAYSLDKLRNRVFEIGPQEQTAWSLANEANRGFKACTDYLRQHLAPYERFYGSPTKVHAGAEIFHFSVAPAYMGRGDLISPLFGGLIGGVNHIVHTGDFRFELWKHAHMLDLLRVGAVVMSAPNEANFPYDPAVFVDRVRFPRWTVYKAPPSGPCGTTAVRPLLVVGSARDWESACEAWLARVQALSDPAALRTLPFFVWEQRARRGRAPCLPLSHFTAIYVADGMLDPERFFQPGELEAFRAAGGTIYLRPSRFHLETPTWASAAVKDLSDIPLAAVAADGLPAPATIVPIEESQGRQVVEVTTTAPCVVYQKMAYYRGWRVTVDGEPASNVGISPGFNACLVPAGVHTVAFTYEGANQARLGWIISGLTLALLIGDACWRRTPREPKGESTHAC